VPDFPVGTARVVRVATWLDRAALTTASCPSRPASSEAAVSADEPVAAPEPRDRPRPPRRRREELPVPAPVAVETSPSPSPERRLPSDWPGGCPLADCPPVRSLPDGGSPPWGTFGGRSGGRSGGGAGLVSPIFGLAGRIGKSAPLARDVGGSGLCAPFVASGATQARSGASGREAGWPFVGSDIGEIPSPGRAGGRRGRHPSSSADEGGPSGALGINAEIDSENTFFVVSFAGPGAR